MEGGTPSQAARPAYREADVDAWVRASQHLRSGMTVEEVVVSALYPLVFITMHYTAYLS